MSNKPTEADFDGWAVGMDEAFGRGGVMDRMDGVDGVDGVDGGEVGRAAQR